VRVLLVEDHQDSRDGLASLLRHWGLEIVTAGTLATALEALPTGFDAIICDIGLPDGTGYAVISEAKRRDKNVLGIALSGYSSPSDIEIGRMAGFNYHLTKPFDCAKIRLLLDLAAPRSA
jgi:CheY-like chemotaxis protein